MKNGVEHRIPLSPRAVEILRALPRYSDFVFPGRSGLKTAAAFRNLEKTMSVILRSEFPAPSHRIHIRTADIEDVAIVGHKLDQIFKMAREAVHDHLEHLRERLPMDEARRLDTEGVYAILHEVHCGLLERLIAIGERLEAS